MEYGAGVNVEGSRGQSPLHNAATAGKEEIIKLLADHGANVNARDKFKKTPLHSAALKGNYYCIKSLIQVSYEVHKI